MIRPLRDLLVIEPLTKTGMVGLIHLPDFGNLADKTGGHCRVVAAGPRCELVKVGDTVHVTAYGSHFAGDEAVVDGRKLLIIRERDINGLVVA